MSQNKVLKGAQLALISLWVEKIGDKTITASEQRELCGMLRYNGVLMDASETEMLAEALGEPTEDSVAAEIEAMLNQHKH